LCFTTQRKQQISTTAHGKKGLERRGFLPSTIAMVDIANNVPDSEYLDAEFGDEINELVGLVDELLLVEPLEDEDKQKTI
jgi:hypothetical protein